MARQSRAINTEDRYLEQMRASGPHCIASLATSVGARTIAVWIKALIQETN